MQIEEILKELCHQLQAYTAAVMLPDYDSKVLKTTYSYNLHPNWAELTNPFDATTNNGIAFTTGAVVLKNRAAQKTLRTATYMHPIESIVVVPIKLNDTIIGTVVVLGDDTNVEFDENSVTLVLQAAHKIKNLLGH